jgi:hypothetical protein
MRRVTLQVSAIFSAVVVQAGCDLTYTSKGGDYDTGPTPPDVYEIDPPEVAGFQCASDQYFFHSAEDLFLDKVTVSGSAEIPSDARLEVPCYDWAGNQSFISSPASLSGGWAAEFSGSPLCFSVGDTSLYPSAMQEYDAIGTFRVYLPLPASGDCADYGDIEWSFDSHGNTMMMMPVSTSEGHSCTPGTGQFKLYSKVVRDADKDGDAILELRPGQISGPAFPERAWLRSITVESFGSAPNLKAVKQGFAASITGEALVPPGAAQVLTPGAPSVALPVGAMLMGTRFVSDQVSLSGTFTPPTVTLSWTCEVDPSAPHYSTFPGPAPFTMPGNTLPGGLAPSTRVALRVDPVRKEAHLKLKGRATDDIVIDLQGTGPAWSFDDVLYAENAEVTGTLTLVGPTATVSFSRLIVAGVDLGTPTWQLMQGPPQ